MAPLSIDNLRKMAEDFKEAAKAPPPAATQNSGRGTTKLGALFANNSADFAEVADALRFISPDVERGNGKVFGPQGSVLPNYWLGIIWGICDGLGERGKELARRWSMQSPRYLNGDGFESAWKEFNPNHPNAITVGSLFLLAQINGWRGLNAGTPVPFNSVGSEQADEVGSLDAPSWEKIRATPFDWPDPKRIPPRPWVFGNWLLRGTATGLIAPGGTGKSTYVSAMALALASGRDLLGKSVHTGPQRVWVYNLEDDRDELARSIWASARFHGLEPADCGDRLYVDSGLSGRGLCTAIEDRNGVQIRHPVIDELVAELIERRIDVMIVDPFVSSHAVNENNNSAIDAVVKQWGRVAARASCSIVLSHHSRKLNGSEVNIDSARGASSLVNAARSVLVFNRLTVAEANKFGVDDEERWRIFSVHDDKHNRAPAEAADWYYIESVQLGNGDSVGAVRVWSPPKGGDGLSEHQLLQIQSVIAAGPARESSQSPEWAGYAVGKILSLDPEKHRGRIHSILKDLTARGLLAVFEGADTKGKLRKFYRVAMQPSFSPALEGG